MKHLILLFCTVFAAHVLLAQNTHFTSSGVIEYEKSVNMFALIKKRINKDNESFFGQAYEAYIKSKPQFKRLKSTLTFSKDKTLFKPIVDENAGNDFFSDPMAEQNNTIFTDISAGTSTAQKKVFDDLFLVKDSTRKINWKITDETRDILGYNCRRANALIMDSIYVVAFYTNEITVSGGPESFSGLPGMILGVALPHENVTWFATKINEAPVQPATMAPPVKGKPQNNKQLRATLEEAMKNWGDYAQMAYKGFLL